MLLCSWIFKPLNDLSIVEIGKVKIDRNEMEKKMKLELELKSKECLIFVYKWIKSPNLTLKFISFWAGDMWWSAPILIRFLQFFLNSFYFSRFPASSIKICLFVQKSIFSFQQIQRNKERDYLAVFHSLQALSHWALKASCHPSNSDEDVEALMKKNGYTR